MEIKPQSPPYMSDSLTETAKQPPDSLPNDLQRWLPRLGLFIDGAQETLLLAITGLAQVGPKPSLATGISEQDWPRLREALLQQGWMREQSLGSGRPWLHLEHDAFQVAWHTLNDDQQSQLKKSFRRHYFQLSGQLLKAITRTDSPAASDRQWSNLEAKNLMQAADWAETAEEPWTAEYLQRLQSLFEHCDIHQFDEPLIQAQTRLLGSEAVIRQQLSNQAERNLKAGQLKAARETLQSLLDRLTTATDKTETEPSTMHARASTHARLGYVLTKDHEYQLAQDHYQRASDLVTIPDPQAAQLELLLRVQLDLLGLHLLRHQAEELEAPVQHICKRLVKLFTETADTAFLDHSERAAWELDRKAKHCRHQTCVAQLQHTARRLRCMSPAGRAMIEDQQYWIQTVALATTDNDIRQQLEAELDSGEQEWPQGVAAIRKLLNGERDEARLCAELELEDAVLIHSVLQEVLK